MASRDREKLVEFLDRKVFDPVLKKTRDEFKSDGEKRKFDDVKRSTESEKRRFHDNYPTAKDVRDNYMSDLSSSTGEKKSKELRDLGLPALPDVRDEFLQLCDQLGVNP